jgi:tetratricopeptide (TPR) repeat protein
MRNLDATKDVFGEIPNRPPLIGIQQIGLEEASDETEIQWRTAQMIARALNTRRVIGFVGSGISRSYNFPSWQQFAVLVVRLALNRLAGVDSQVCKVLQAYVRDSSARSANKADPRLSLADRTLTVLGYCDQAMKDKLTKQEYEDFRKEVAKIFENEKGSPAEPSLDDPLLAIMQRLEIRRFLTTNYDLCIESAFERAGTSVAGNTYQTASEGGLADYSTMRVRPAAQSLAFGVDGPEELLQFAVGAPGHEMGVFHLHGVARHPESMIVTEGDYQLLYIRDDAWHRAYREALRLAFSANPVLFMGVGLTEADLLQPLRQFVSERAGPRPERPLFALYEEPKDKRQAAEWRRYLYMRFGLKVLYYQPNGAARMQMTRTLIQAINDLAKRWLEWWQWWQHKPRVRAPVFRKINGSRTMVRHETETSNLLPTEDDGELDEALKKHRVVLALGRPGTGKGSLGLVRAKQHDKQGRSFFATAHFTNDFLSMVQAAADHLDPEDAQPGSDPKAPPTYRDPIERLQEVLAHRPHLFVLGGIERLLIPLREDPTLDQAAVGNGKRREIQEADSLTQGRPISTEAARFLSAIVEVARNRGPGSVFLTSSIWPVTFNDPPIRTVRLKGVSLETLKRRFPKEIDEGLIKRLWVALDRHAYALAVVAKALKRIKKPLERVRRLNQLIAQVTAIDLPRRTEKAIEFCFTMLVEADIRRKNQRRKAEILEGVLERVALFSTPVPEEAITFTYQDKRGLGQAPTATADEVHHAIETLTEANLLLQIRGDHLQRFTAHTIVRTYVLKLLGCLAGSPGEAQHFRVGGFATEETEAEPGSLAGYRLITSCVDRLLENIEEEQRGAAGQPNDEKETRRQIIRAAFALIRSRWTATGVARLGGLVEESSASGSVSPYDQYRQRLARLLNSIRREGVRRDEWDRVPALSISPEGILYADELLWLYNELALSAFCQGSMPDAHALFRMVEDLVELAEPQNSERWGQSEINLGLVQLERGWLRRAQHHFENAMRVGARLPQGDIKSQAIGYLGLVSHLSGEYARAKDQYDTAIESIKLEPNGRALSIFYRHRGDLQRKLGKLKEAQRDIQASVAAAESGRYPDLLYYARLAQANIQRRRDKDLKAVNMVSGAADFARQVGLPKLETDAYIVHAQFALKQGDIDLAGRRSAQALAVSSALGMGLRLTGAMVLAARVAKVRGYPGQARQILQAAIKLAVRQGHQIRVEAAEQELMELPQSE